MMMFIFLGNHTYDSTPATAIVTAQSNMKISPWSSIELHKALEHRHGTPSQLSPDRDIPSPRRFQFGRGLPKKEKEKKDRNHMGKLSSTRSMLVHAVLIRSTGTHAVLNTPLSGPCNPPHMVAEACHNQGQGQERTGQPTA